MNEFLKWVSGFTCIKSITTLALTITFCYIIVSGSEINDYFQTVYTMVMTFYFSRQWEKKAEEKNNGKS